MQCLPFLSENRREAFSMFPKRKKFQWFRILGMFSVLWHAQHTRVHRNSQKNESIHCNYIYKKNFARGWFLREFTLEHVKDWSLTVYMESGSLTLGVDALVQIHGVSDGSCDIYMLGAERYWRGVWHRLLKRWITATSNSKSYLFSTTLDHHVSTVLHPSY